ncbi:protein of unknown function [Chryseobacterium oranimense]|uniref:Lin1244/Lin1753-like N-terminal domain-containing protein n=1 Tax=Chryseobacterium oranimense TaxID=421058 RepID=A0A1M5WQY1_9FLAO|nr:Lin1244/Lin1753 domain-containing protein [Chryseobacterium oranimense]SHH89918.1 protein of unknown function [Chryseobacterium oranimense]
MSNKEAYYFSHDSNARQDDKIVALRMKHGWEGYGVYWALVEKLRESSGYMSICDYNIIAYDLRTDAALIKSIIENFRLFSFTEIENLGKCFYSESLKNRMEKKSSKARESANKRWGREKEMQTQCERIPNAMRNDAIKEKKSIVYNITTNSINNLYNYSFVKINDFHELYKNFEFERKYLFLAYKFWEIWNKENPNQKTLTDAKISKWYEAIRLIVEVDKQKPDKLLGIYCYFLKCTSKESGFDDFWFKTVKSVSAFRKKDKDEVYYLDKIISQVNDKIAKDQDFSRLVQDTIKKFNK